MSAPLCGRSMSLVEELRSIIGGVDAPGDRAETTIDEARLAGLESALARAIPKLRAAAAMRCGEMRPGRFICHRDAHSGFVVMVLAWGPGDATPVHDHGVWGVEAVLEGSLTVTDYDDGEPVDLELGPRALRRKVIGPGLTMSNLPPARDVHKVENSGAGRCLSVHVYGREITGNRIFVPGRGFQACAQQAAEYGFLDVAGVCEGGGWETLWSESSML